MATLDHRQHLESLDGVRGVAILMIFCHHLCPFSGSNPIALLCSTLWLGVDLFFVLSGFLITGVLHDTLGQPGYFRNFYMRRALRLLPVYVAVVAMVLVANAALGGSLTIWALPYFVYGSNIVRDLGLPTGIVQHLDVSHFWSLAVEEQFYLLWPLAVVLAGTRRRMLWLCIAGSLLSVLLRFVAAGHPHVALGTPYFELPTRLDSLLLGGAVALLLRCESTAVWLSQRRLYGVLTGGLAALAASFVVSGHATMFAAPMVRYGYLAASVSFAALIGLAALPGSWVARACSTAWLRAFGRCSYGLYLIHFIPQHWYYAALHAVQSRCPNAAVRDAASFGIFLAYLLLCFGLATLSYTTLERYFLNKKRSFRYSDERIVPHRAPAYAD